MAQREEVLDRVRALCLARRARKQQLKQLMMFEQGHQFPASFAALAPSKETQPVLASPANTCASGALSSDSSILEADLAAWEEFSAFLNLKWLE